jgi:hypothetical protein
MTYKSSALEWYQDKKLISILQTMWCESVSEDQMATFCYTKQKEFSEKDTYTKKRHQRTTLFFNYLKKYRLTAAQLNESLPQHAPVAQLSLLKKYPTFIELCRNLFHLRYALNRHNPFDLIYWLYDETQKEVKELHAATDSFDTIDQFYDEAYKQLHNFDEEPHSIEMYERVYDLLNTTKVIKAKFFTDTEIELGYNILNTKEDSMWGDIFGKTKFKKNIAAIWCNLVEKYNQSRGKKNHPKPYQIYIYGTKNIWNLTVSDTFDRRLISEKRYAFNEFAQLLIETRELMTANSEEVQQWVNRLYY